MKKPIERLSSSRNLATGIMWNAVGRGLPTIIALFATPFLVHHLGVDRWALFTLALSVGGSFSILDLGIGAALTRALAERIGTPREAEAAPLIVIALALLTVTSCAGSAIGYVMTPAIVDWLLHPPPDLRSEAILAFQVLALCGPLIVLNAAIWGVFAAYQRFRLVTLVNIPTSIMYNVGPILVLLVSPSLVGVIAALSLARLVQLVVCVRLVMYIVPDLLNQRRLRPRLLLSLMRIGIWVTVSNTLWPIMLYFDRFIVGAMLSLAAVSFYATPLDLAMRLMIIPMVVSTALFPAVATSHQHRPERTQALLRAGSLIVLLTVFPACVLTVGSADWILGVWLGPAFAAGSSTVLVVLSVGAFLNCTAVLPGTLTDAVGRPEISTAILAAQALLFPPLVVLLTFRYGIEGSAVAWTARASVNCLARWLACYQLDAGTVAVIPKSLAVIACGTLSLVVCPLVQPIVCRFAVMAATLIVVPLIAGIFLVRKEELMQGLLAVHDRLQLQAMARTERQT